MAANFLGCWDIYVFPPTAAAKFINKCSLFLLKFKEDGQAKLKKGFAFD
jgi:hypothetical protein